MAEEIKKEEEVVVEEAKDEEAKEPTYDELKAEAEALEAENKTLKVDKEEGDKASNAAIRLQKAKDENAKLTAKEPEAPVSKEMDAEDIYTLRDNKFAKDSDEAKVLAEFAQMPRNAGKSYEELMTQTGVQAELTAIKVERDAKDIVDENDNSEAFLATKNEINSRYKERGEIPETESQVKDLASSNLDAMGM